MVVKSVVVLLFSNWVQSFKTNADHRLFTILILNFCDDACDAEATTCASLPRR
jgi:hypothetical protein